MSRLSGLICFSLVTTFLLSGCATHPIVEPTYEELEATKEFKKTIAVVDFSDDDSPLKGIEALASAKLDRFLIRHFNLVERSKIKAIEAERSFGDIRDVERLTELGEFLGADYLLFGDIIATISTPEIDYRRHEYDDGNFSGKIWEEVRAESEISVKIVDVANGIVVYSGNNRGSKKDDIKEERFSDKKLFEKELLYRKTADKIKDIVGYFTKLDKEYSKQVSRAIDRAISRLASDLKKKFPQSGEVVRVLSDYEVTVNLGSAYGIKPGDRLIVWQEKAPFKDPKTGTTTVPKEKKAILRVKKVTSGLTSVARGSFHQVKTLRPGDKVYTYK